MVSNTFDYFLRREYLVQYLNSVDDIFESVSKLQQKYDFIKCEVIGKSLCGRKIKGLQIGNEERMVLFTCAFHGMEWLTSLVVLRFLDTLSGLIYNREDICGINIFKCLEDRGLYVIPCVNPDGVEISLKGSTSAKDFQSVVEGASGGKTFDWQANARGVDINHNFDANWEKLHKLEKLNKISCPAKTRYGGKYPESEPETRAITKLCRSKNFDYAIAFHSQGEEIYWKYGDKIPNGSETLARIFALTSEYVLSSPEGLAQGGGFKDWFITEFNKPAFTIEIGKGKNPLSISCLNDIYSKLFKMMLLTILI